MPILDFWGPYAKLWGFVRVSLRLESRSWKELEKQYLFCGLCFQLVFILFIFLSLCQETDFYVERVTAHRIKINDHSCFHNRLPNSKTKLKLKHLWEQGGPLCFGGPTQLAYSAYREDRRWCCVSSGCPLTPTFPKVAQQHCSKSCPVYHQPYI